MIEKGKRGYLSTGIGIIIIIASFWLTSLSPAYAKQTQKADTVSTAGVTFTDIPTVADSIATKKLEKKLAEKLKTSTTTVAAEKPKTLWEIFIEGFLGGF